ncbi:MAG: TetR/AcrR family transcriptional regulator [Chloroflexi bacterium]|nr:TetR/AcrR family transcriptional regulator [Chloroflexota bacterium]
MHGKVDDRRIERSTQIIQTGRRLFADRGYHNCRVADIARGAGMSTGNVYWHFASKEDLLHDILAESFAEQDALVHGICSRTDPVAVRVDMLFCEYVDYYCTHWDSVQLTLALLAHDGIALFHRLGLDVPQVGARYHPGLTALISAGRDAGILLDLPPHLLCSLMFSYLNGQAITCDRSGFSHRRDLTLAALRRLLCKPAGE